MQRRISRWYDIYWLWVAPIHPHLEPLSIYMMNVNSQFWSRWHCEWWCEWFLKKTLEHIWNVFATPRLYIYCLRDFALILEIDPHFRPRCHIRRSWADVFYTFSNLTPEKCCVATTPSLFSAMPFQSKTWDLKVGTLLTVFISEF